MRSIFGGIIVAAMTFSALQPASAFDLKGQKSIVLHTRDGKDIAFGKITFTPDGEKTKYKLDVDESKLKEFFLSLRQFKCLEGPEITCYVPYPYKSPHTVTDTDLAWLEHDLLFMWKRPNDYGAQMQNGIIYKLKVADDGIVGKPQAIDLDKIASPPEDQSKPPYKAEDRYELQPDARWISSLRIK